MLLSLAFAALAGLVQEPDRIAELVRKLAADNFAEREKATEELRRMGKPAEEALRKAAEGDDAEVSSRAKALLENLNPSGPKPDPKRGPRPGPPPAFQGFPGFRGGSVQVQSVNGESTYVITPGDGAPPLTFRKKAEGAVKLDYSDEKGKAQSAESDSLEKFLKEHKELAGHFGIGEEGIDYAGARVSFKGGILPRGNGFNFNEFGRRGPGPFPHKGEPMVPAPQPQADFEPASEALRAQLGLPEGRGVVALRDGVLPGILRFDVVLDLDGQPVGGPGDVRRLARPGSVLAIIRKGERKTLGGDRKDF